jgi:hypothetical protein
MAVVAKWNQTVRGSRSIDGRMLCAGVVAMIFLRLWTVGVGVGVGVGLTPVYQCGENRSMAAGDMHW